MGGIRIIGLGKSVGERKVENGELAKIVDTSDEWIREKTGIRSRFFAETKTNADMASEAAAEAIKNAGIDREDIGLCIVSTFTPDDFTPAVACTVAGRLGLMEDALAFDLNGACAGFTIGCNVANGILGAVRRDGTKGFADKGGEASCCAPPTAASGAKNSYALVIGSERISPLMNMNDRTTCVLFGDGAGAAVVEYDDKSEFSFAGGVISDREVLHCGREGASIAMQGQEVYRFAVSKVPEVIKKVMAASGKTSADVDSFVCHQANERIIDNVAKKISENGDSFYKNLYCYGNTSAASIPIALRDMELEGRLKSGSRLVCAGFGAGLTYGAIYITRA